MRVICPDCHSKAFITSTNQLSMTVKDLYCACSNTKACGATFVFTLAFKHQLIPPQKTLLEITKTMVNNLNKAQKDALQLELF